MLEAVPDSGWQFSYWGDSLWVSDNPVSIKMNVNYSIKAIFTQQIGNLQVTLGPAGAVSAGAQWNVDGGTWQNSGDTVMGLPVGSHTINYNSVTGWTAPASEQFTITDGQTNSISRNYTQQQQQTGNLQVTLGPAGAISAGAKWNVDSGTWQNSATTVTSLSVGSHTVNYMSVTGWTAPASESVTITNGLTNSISRNYIHQTGNLQVTLGPAGAVSAGAQWNVDGNAWQNSAATVTGLSVGLHTVNYKSVTSWIAPASEQVTITNGQTNSISRNYTQQASNLSQFGGVECSWRDVGGQWIWDCRPDNQGNVKLTLKDCEGNDVTFSLTGGGYGEIDSGDCTFSSVALYNTTEKSIFTIKTRSGIETSVGNIISNGPLKSITAKTTNLRGDIVVNGSLGTLTLNDIADNHTITIGSSSNSKVAVTIVFDRVAELSIDSQTPIKSLTATEWLGGSINAPYIGSITTKGDKKRSITGGLDVDVTSGIIQSIKSAGTLSGDWKCTSVKSISAAHIVETKLSLSQIPDAKNLALGKLTTTGWIDSSQIISKGNIGTVSASKMVNSSCFAGVADGITGLPAAEADSFSSTATIKSVTIKGIKTESPPYYINSNIASANILNASLAYPENNNGGVPFGMSAGFIKALKVKDAQGTESWKNLDKPSDSKTFTDAQIRLY